MIFKIHNMVPYSRTSASAKKSVAYAAPGEFAGEIYLFICHEKNIIWFRRFIEHVEEGRPNFVAAATAKV